MLIWSGPKLSVKRRALKPNRDIRSADKLVLNVPITKFKAKAYGDRCLSIAGPGINFPVILDSPSELMFLKSLWIQNFSKMHLTTKFYSSDVFHIYILYSYRD